MEIPTSKMAQLPENDSGMVPRSYQLELLEDIKKDNTILYLPTGCGKTYIATMLVKHMGECLTRPIGNGRKWTFFIVHTIAVLNQHANFLRSNLPWNIGEFSGDTKIKKMSPEAWDGILEKYHVLVMTPQIYLNNLLHGFMKIKDANLLIFDECHHAVASHPFRQIMQLLHNSKLKSNERPHILGLTATLINSKTKNVKNDLLKLQITFNSSIKTICNKNIQSFSARPEEFIRLYDENSLDNELLAVTYRISKMANLLKIIQNNPKNETKIDIGEGHYVEEKSTNKWENYLWDIELHLIDGGAYIAYLNTLHFIKEIEKKQKTIRDVKKCYIMSLVLSEVTIIRKMLYDYMNQHPIIHENHSTTLQNVSPKVKTLMEELFALKANDSCLVFVLRRTTAKTLYHYINKYIQENNLKNIACEFIVGGKGMNNYESQETHRKQLQNNDIVKKFNSNITNVLITSQVLEEGIDIQSCNVVIRYDSPTNFTSYIQSKGRARSAASKFITMVPNFSRLSYEGTQHSYSEMERDIKKILGVNDDEDEDNIDDCDNSIMFKTKHATLNYENARLILNSYCHSLYQDHLSDLKPKWYIVENENKHKKYKLILPINSVIKTPIDGMYCINQKNAKSSAAFMACIELYKVGAIDEYLRPISIKNKDMLNNLEWFPHWVEENIELSKYKLKAGTKQVKRMVHTESPTYLHGSYPQVNKPSYLHVINCVPDYIQLKESKYKAFDKLLRSIKEFGILTSNKLPQVSSFPIFLHFGEVNVSIQVNVDEICLDHKTLKELDNFHNKLFMDVLGVKDFVARSYDNEDNSYLVVPIFFTDDIYHLDWNVININKFVETEEKPTMEQINSKFYEKYLCSTNVISLWYKNESPVERFIVTEVHLDMGPESSFESPEYDTYVEYFIDKYQIQVCHKDQPLIKVKSLEVSEMNYLTSRHALHKLHKQTKPDLILVPEFCTWHKFPSDYWLKALMLPTILFQLEKLLLAEELLTNINFICNIEVEGNTNKDTLKIDNFLDFNENKNENIVMEISETLKCTLNNMDEFDLNNVPNDIERIRKQTMSDLENYQSEGNYNIKDQQTNSSSEIKKKLDDVPTILMNEMNPLNLTNNLPPILSPLIKEISKQIIWPQQSDILKAITPPKVNHMFNYECMETYGDSFLKFAVSLVLFDAFPLSNEGVLTSIRIKIIGNQNLYYVGRNSNIASYMVHNADLNTIWIPPCFGIPKKIKDTIEENNILSGAIYQIIIPKDYQVTGMLSDETWTEIENKLLQFNEFSISNSIPKGDSKADLLFHKKSVSDKTVSDCVESLIGTYVYKCGVEVGFKVLCGLGIIPKQRIDTFKPNPIKNQSIDLNISNILPGYKILEERIGYSFKHKHLLIQALTHPSYGFGISECYQRLEFLGDAILDFLITTHIVEHGNTQRPGSISEIRSSLVNNTVFGSLSARIGLHRFVLAQSPEMTKANDHFYEYLKKNNYQIDQEVLCLVEDNNCYAAESFEVPKVLSDLFESLIGAIYLDCNRDLNVVWAICYRFLEKEINTFCNKIPKSTMNILYSSKLKPIFRTPHAACEAASKGLGAMVELEVYSNEKKSIIYGFGPSTKEAKLAAAKMVLKNIKKDSQ